jgi:uncharacterized protein YyaL (SSP411 family)
MVDMQAGGLRGAPKFPNAPFMQTLWLAWLKNGNPAYRDAVLVSLEKMLSGSIYDHVGGGLSRYSTDAEWLVPHFEKMLYDNAQLIRQCNWAFAQSGNELFCIRIEETVDWLLREMRVKGGAFASSLDADSEGEEGLFYTWTQDEIEAALAADSSLLFQYLTLSAPRGWEGKPILHQTDAQRRDSVEARAELAAMKAKLLLVRERRIRPGRDDKVLTDWNGLMIAALAEAGRSLDRRDWIHAAETAFAFIVGSCEAGRLPHSMLDGQKLFPALSSDYAAMANAAVSLFEATGNERYVANARQFLEQLDRWHGDAERGGYYLTASDSTDVPMRIRGDVDEAIPSATSQIIEAMARISTLTGDEELEKHTSLVAEHAAGRAAKQAYGQAGIVNACALVMEPLKLVVVENPTEPKLVTVANRNPDPRRVDIFVAIGTVPNLSLLPDGASPPLDRPGAYLCTGQICLPAIADPTELEARLRRS